MHIKDLIKVKLTANQLQALTSLAEDIGMVLFQIVPYLKKSIKMTLMSLKNFFVGLFVMAEKIQLC